MAFGLEDSTIENIKKILKKYNEVDSARIFGSRARGDYKKSSDIDIALFGENVTNSINTNIFYEIDELYLPYKIDLINFNTLETEPNLKENILEQGIEFYKKEIC